MLVGSRAEGQLVDPRAENCSDKNATTGN